MIEETPEELYAVRYTDAQTYMERNWLPLIVCVLISLTALVTLPNFLFSLLPWLAVFKVYRDFKIYADTTAFSITTDGILRRDELLDWAGIDNLQINRRELTFQYKKGDRSERTFRYKMSHLSNRPTELNMILSAYTNVRTNL